eukprot:TRINITY_DN6125_c0_g1_i2.p1 TRINITY_DN6125_c0_g1~~TRINITY_DN6125_c0_g1_i2.p1  ORF type:complete len:231 (+),score=35.76 TRINITY_DN6125_c0_g1_i2:62-754(+)
MHSPLRRRESAFRMLAALIACYSSIQTIGPTKRLFVGAPQHKQNVQSLLQQHLFQVHSTTASPSTKRGRASDLDLAQEVTGTVTQILDFGAELDLGLDMRGWIAMADFGEKRIGHVSEVAAVGDQVRARVLYVKRNEVVVSIKDRPEFAKRPLSEFTEGDEIDATVQGIGKTRRAGATVIYFDVGAVTHAYALGRGETVLQKGMKVKVKVNEVSRHSISVALLEKQDSMS